MQGSTGIAVMGASGRMGQMLIKLVNDNDTAHLVAVTERAGHDWAGRDLGACMGGAATGVMVHADPIDAIVNAQAVIDFTSPDATVAHAQLTAQARCVHVIGTTGMDDSHHQALGVNLLMQITKQVAAALDEDFDIEVIEAHHHHKVDAPSGTALMLGQAAAEGRGIDLNVAKDSGRDGITGARQRGHIGFSAIRGGDIVGEHDVLFAGQGERITLRHVATDRAIFARGALKAALWGQGKGPGRFDMLDVLGMR